MRPSWQVALKWLIGPPSRRSWQVDLKWLFGLACLVSIVAAATLYSASKLTEQQPATGVFAGIVGEFMKDDDDFAEEFNEIQARAVSNPDAEYTIGDVTLPVKGYELEGLSYDEAVDLVLGRVADILYTEGPDTAAQYFDTSEEGSEGEEEEVDLGPFGLLTRETHVIIRRIFTFSLIPVLVLAVPLVFFSTRFGRLGSAGIVLAVGIASFAVLWLIAKQVTKDASEDGMEGVLAEAISPTAGGMSGDFLRLLILGLALVLVAVVGHISVVLWRRFRRTPAPVTEEITPSAHDGPPSIGPGGVPQA